MINGTRLELKVNSEFGKLRAVIVQNPAEIDILNLEESSPDTSFYLREKDFHPEDANFNPILLREQISAFQKVLHKDKITLLYINTIPNARYQLFTRDLGFVIGDTFYFSRMLNERRRIEYEGLEIIKKRLTKYQAIESGTIEGGDILINGSHIYVGLTGRTNRDGFESLKSLVEKQGYCCIPIPCRKNILHLDCRFNIISPDTALIYGDDILPEGRQNIKTHFKGNIISGPTTEQDTLGSNFLILSPNLAVVERRNQWTIETLGNQGYSVIPLDFSELIKLWGSFRCTTLPIYRK